MGNYILQLQLQHFFNVMHYITITLQISAISVGSVCCVCGFCLLHVSGMSADVDFVAVPAMSFELVCCVIVSAMSVGLACCVC